jgi:hypothetical protein
LGLCGGGGDRPLPQLFARRFTGPCTRVNVAHRDQPLFGFRECWEIAHVQAESLAAFFKTATDKEGEALELRLLWIRQRHRRCRRS